MSPRLVRNLVYPLHEWLVGRPTFRVFREMERSQWWPLERIVELQNAKLRGLLLQAWDRCPAHRRRLADAGFSRGDLTRIEVGDMPALPILDKATIALSL